jgi:hypothetical protein
LSDCLILRENPAGIVVDVDGVDVILASRVSLPFHPFFLRLRLLRRRRSRRTPETEDVFDSHVHVWSFDSRTVQTRT